MKNKADILKFNNGVDGVLPPRAKLQDRLPRPDSLVPCEQPMRSALTGILAQPSGIDDLLVKALQPVVQDTSCLTPVHYHALLNEAYRAIQSLAEQQDNEVLQELAQVLNGELTLLNQIGAQRGIVSR